VSDWTLHTGDCLSVLPTLKAGSVDSVITDPPAGISFMGLEFDSDRGGRLKWVEWLASVLRECLRVAKPGATAAVWALPRTSHWTGCALEEAGWEIFDIVTHLFGAGMPKGIDVGKAIDRAVGAEREVGPHRVRPDGTTRPKRENWSGANGTLYAQDEWTHTQGGRMGGRESAPATDAARLWDGWHSGLKPAAEFWWLARKPLDGSYAHNALTHGVAGLYVDGCRVEGTPRTTHADGNRRVTSSADGNVPMRMRPHDATPAPAGRYPANVVLGCACEGEGYGPDCPVRLLDEQAGERGGKWGDQGRSDIPKTGNVYGKYREARREQTENFIGDVGGPSRFFTRLHYCAKASRRERGEGNDHKTVKPLSLMRWLCRLTKTPTGGVVLDPFAGSGTTLLAALLEGRRAIGIEKDPGYAETARKRLAGAQGPLFAHAGGEA
jgi:hypothetical protein